MPHPPLWLGERASQDWCIGPGVPIFEQMKWRGKIDRILHGAASIKFKETHDREIFLTNVYGTQQLLELARVLNVPEFHYVSTAYVLGDAPVFTENDLRIGQQTRNDYEQSKLEAEELVRQYWNDRFSIYRIPIVVGDSKTARDWNLPALHPQRAGTF